METSLNDKLRLGAASAAACSPLHGVRARAAPMRVVVGEEETPAFVYQSRLHEAWIHAGNRSALHLAPRADHFSLLRHFASPGSSLFGEVDAHISRRRFNRFTRLQGRTLQGPVVSYHSLPIHDSTGKFWGTLCHFDMKSLSLSDLEFQLLQGGRAAARPTRRGLRHARVGRQQFVHAEANRFESGSNGGV